MITYDQMVVVLALFPLGLALFALSYWYGPILVGWLYADGKLTRFFERLLLLIYTTFFGLLSSVVGLLYAVYKASQAHLDPQGFLHKIVTLPPSITLTATVCILCIVFAVVGEAVVLSTVGAVIVAAYILAFILELGLKMVRAFAWRVVEYNKGAAPAIVLVLTCFVGLWKLYLDHH